LTVCVSTGSLALPIVVGVARLAVPEFLKPLEPSIERIRRADPFMMSAAIAYNFFFAIVPLSIAFIAVAVLLGSASSRSAQLEAGLRQALPPEIAGFFVSLFADAQQSLSGSTGTVIVIALLVALYSGSRGIYAVIKAIRLMQGTVETRPWLVVRGLGVAFTIGAGISLLVGQLLIVLGGHIAGFLDYYMGLEGAETITEFLVLPTIVIWTIALIASIYAWGPPRRVDNPIVSGTIATVLVALATWLFALIVPRLGSSTLAALGTIGVLLVWVYAMAFIVITVPELVSGAVAMSKHVISQRR